jgi:hypothetical protein
MASGPAATVPSSSTHCTAASACSSVRPSDGRSANCQGITVARDGMRRSMNCAQLVQNEQSPS